MQCPICQNIALVMSERQGVEIDYCPQCRGIWLDRGELDKIIERSSATSIPSKQTYERDDKKYQQDDHKQHLHGYFKKEEQSYHKDIHSNMSSHNNNPKKKEGFLSELFDF